MNLENNELQVYHDRFLSDLQSAATEKLRQVTDQHEDFSGALRRFLSTKLHQKSEVFQRRLFSELSGAGPLDGLISDPAITEILVLDHANIWFEKNGRLMPHSDSFCSELSYTNFIRRLSRESGSRYDLSTPVANGLWNHFRVHMVAPPLTESALQLCLRRHPVSPWTLKLLQEQGWSDEEGLQQIRQLVLDKRNFLILGPTSSGKTSVLNACLQELHSNERVVTIEDTSEIQLPNRVSSKLLTRMDISDVLKDYSQSDLLKEALRMRPDRIVVGEVRGGEAKDLLMALATGHKGGMCTLHADSARQALLRLELLIQLGAPQWSAPAIRHLILLSLQNLVVLTQIKGERKLEGIYRIASLEDTGFCLEQVY